MGENSPRFLVAFSILLLAFAISVVMAVVMVAAAHAATAPTPTLARIIDIQDDPGGDVMEYYKNFLNLSKEGVVVRLHGYCASACPMMLFREYTGIKACAADENAFFMFHKPFLLDQRHKIVKSKKATRITRAMWAAWLSSFPYDVYNLLKDARIPSATEGDSPDDMFVVPAIFFVPACEAAQ